MRWLGTVPYSEALALQQGLFSHGHEQHLLLLEHPHVFTYGPRTDLAANLRCEPAAVGAELIAVKRGGDVTYHGPGQLVGYPIITVANRIGAADHVAAVQSVVVATLTELGLADVGVLPEYPGVWVGVSGPNPRKICAIGVRLSRGRTMHGFALNVATDLTYMREHIVPCGIADKPVTSLAEEGIDVPMRTVVDVLARHAAAQWGGGHMERQDVAWKHRPDDLFRMPDAVDAAVVAELDPFPVDVRRHRNGEPAADPDPDAHCGLSLLWVEPAISDRDAGSPIKSAARSAGRLLLSDG